MKTKRFCSAALAAALTLSLTAVSAQAADYSFKTDAPADYYTGTVYEEVYGSQYNYGGPNVVDFQQSELEFGLRSTTQTGVMERTILPNLQAVASAGSSGHYGIQNSNGTVYLLPETIPTERWNGAVTSYLYQPPAYTSVEGMAYSDGSIGTIKIPSLGISMKVWEGETSTSMSKGVAHYSATSAWNGNVSLCGHNRGARYVIGSIKDLKAGDIITYTTVYGTRTYAVTTVQIISNSDWSYLQATADNRITLTTCLANHPESRVCVQAQEVIS